MSSLKRSVKYVAIGLSVAMLEEFITQGVLKRNIVGWIVPSFVAFVPFLVGMGLVFRVLRRKIDQEHRAILAFYLMSGGVGLMIEWFVIGLSPWSGGGDPLLMLVFQLGMFSFWGTVAFAPRFLLDHRKPVGGLRKWYKRSLEIGFAAVYLVAFLSGRQAQFIAGIGSVLILFLSLNVFHFKYIRRLGLPITLPATTSGPN